jgi:hypothetical protein
MGASTHSSSSMVSGSCSRWLEAFSQAPVLVEAYGSTLPDLLQELLPVQRSSVSDGGAAKQQ